MIFKKIDINYNKDDININNLNYRKKIVVNKKGNINQNNHKKDFKIEQEDDMNFKNSNDLFNIK